MRLRSGAALAALTVLVLLAGCTSAGGDEDAARSTSTRPTVVQSSPVTSTPSSSTSASVVSSVPLRSPEARTLVALGDSFASGVGASGVMLDCGRSPDGWTGLLAAHLGMDFVNLACSGATLTETIEQVSELPSDADVVAVTAGGNSLKFGQVVVLCVSGQCEAGWDTAMENLSRIRPETLRLLEEIRRAAPDVAAIALTLYPSSTRKGLTCGRVTDEVGSLFAQGTELLNAEILAAATDARSRGIPVVVVVPSEFVGHALCSPDPWFHDFDKGMLVMHPNDAGYAALAVAARDAIVSAGN